MTHNNSRYLRSVHSREIAMPLSADAQGKEHGVCERNSKRQLYRAAKNKCSRQRMN